MKDRKIQFILFAIAVLILTWLLLPVFSFASSEQVKMEKADAPVLVKATQAWAKPTLKGQSVGAAYVTLKNDGKKALALVDVSASIAGRAEIHTHIHEDGIMQMRQLPRLDVLPKTDQVMQPGGLHLMLFDLKEPLEKGKNFTLTLKFSDGMSKEVQVDVRDVG